MSAGTWNFSIRQGETLAKGLLITVASTGLPFNLTGCSARCQARNKVTGAVLFDLRSSSGSPPNIQLTGTQGILILQDTWQDTALYEALAYDVDLFLLLADGVTNVAFTQGTFTVIAAVTSPPV